MNSRDFTIEIRNKTDFLAEVREDLCLIESGKKEEELVERFFFESMDAANRLLTQKRVELLRRLHDSGAINTHELAKQLSRDYNQTNQGNPTFKTLSHKKAQNAQKKSKYRGKPQQKEQYLPPYVL